MFVLGLSKWKYSGILYRREGDFWFIIFLHVTTDFPLVFFILLYRKMFPMIWLIEYDDYMNICTEQLLSRNALLFFPSDKLSSKSLWNKLHHLILEVETSTSYSGYNLLMKNWLPTFIRNIFIIFDFKDHKIGSVKTEIPPLELERNGLSKR